jgi:hypothetical protein
VVTSARPALMLIVDHEGVLVVASIADVGVIRR